MTAADIMIVDDCQEWRLRLRSFLEVVPGFRVVAEAADGLEAVEKAAQMLPDIVLLDIGLPKLNGIEAAPRIERASPSQKLFSCPRSITVTSEPQLLPLVRQHTS